MNLNTKFFFIALLAAAITAAAAAMVVSAHSSHVATDEEQPQTNFHVCEHDKIKDRSKGTGVNAEVVPQTYEFHTDEAFLKLHKKKFGSGKNNKNNKKEDNNNEDEAAAAAAALPSFHHLRQAQALQVNPAGTLGNMRFKAFFDSTTCPGSDCGRCDSEGQTVQTFEGGTVTCSAEDVLTTAKRDYINNKLMPKAMETLKYLLRINPVSGPLVVGGTSYCGSPGAKIPSSHASPGISDADFAIYVTAAPKADSSSLTVAWALKCRVDGSNRPIAAHVNFVPRRLSNAVKLDPISTEADVITAVHEITHALGFAAPFFGGTYVDLAGTPTAGGTTTVGSSAPLNKNRDFITSPRVVNEVRSYFNCPTLVGAEIEDGGGAGTAGSHFEKRLYQQHAMAGISTTVAAFPSRLLLAFFEDTGHYLANYSAIDQLHHGYISYGRGKGCAFVDQRCDSDTNKASGEWCFSTDTQNEKFCTFDGLAKGYCGATTGLTVPSNMQYLGDSQTGSSIQIDDFCPTALFYSNQRCVDLEVTPVQGGGERYGGSSRCFQSNLKSTSSSLLGGGSGGGGAASKTTTAAKSTRCFQAQCNGDGTMSVVVDLRVYPCPKDGSAGKADLTGLTGYEGDILCPPALRYCPSNWNGTGLPQLVPSPETAVTYAPAFAEPLPGTCKERETSCAAKLLHLLPRCREFAFKVSRCFGTDCDPDMAAWLNQNGAANNCSGGRSAFDRYCQESSEGAQAVCDLASAGALVWGVLVAVLLMLFLML